MDSGDNVIVVNAAKALLTGDKLKKKVYYHHTGYIGEIKERTAGQILRGKFPERIVEKAGGTPCCRADRSGKRQLGKSAGLSGCGTSPRGRKQPEKLDVAKMNPRTPTTTR